MFLRALPMQINERCFRHSSLTRLLQLSMWAVFLGLPGMNEVAAHPGHSVIPLKLEVFKRRIFSGRYLRGFTMKNGRFSDARIMAVLKQAEGGVPVSELCLEHRMSIASFYK